MFSALKNYQFGKDSSNKLTKHLQTFHKRTKSNRTLTKQSNTFKYEPYKVVKRKISLVDAVNEEQTYRLNQIDPNQSKSRAQKARLKAAGTTKSKPQPQKVLTKMKARSGHQLRYGAYQGIVNQGLQIHGVKPDAAASMSNEEIKKLQKETAALEQQRFKEALEAERAEYEAEQAANPKPLPSAKPLKLLHKIELPASPKDYVTVFVEALLLNALIFSTVISSSFFLASIVDQAV